MTEQNRNPELTAPHCPHDPHEYRECPCEGDGCPSCVYAPDEWRRP